MVWLAGLMVATSAMLSLPPAFVAVIVTLSVPVAFGVPEIKPVMVLMLRLAPSPVAAKLVGELLAVI